MTAGAAARYPNRPPAKANALDIVRTTTNWPGNWSINPIALGRSENSAYASSTTTIPGAARTSARMSCSGRDPPLGLFGLVMNSTSGCRSATDAQAASMSMLKSGRRGLEIQLVLVPEAMIGCIEYDGSKPSADRPGPANACSS